MLRRLAAKIRWKELEEEYGKYASQLNEISAKLSSTLLQHDLELLTGNLSASFLYEKCVVYVTAVHEKVRAFKHCTRFIDGIVKTFQDQQDFSHNW